MQAIAFHRHEWPRLPLLHIGGGSNLLFMHDFPGTILHSAILGVQPMAQEEDKVLVRVGAGMKWDEWVEYSLSRGWYGLENLSLIPGEVGASSQSVLSVMSDVNGDNLPNHPPAKDNECCNREEGYPAHPRRCERDHQAGLEEEHPQA